MIDTIFLKLFPILIVLLLAAIGYVLLARAVINTLNFFRHHRHKAQTPPAKAQQIPSETNQNEVGRVRRLVISAPQERGNVLIAGTPGDGKTQALIRFLVDDVACGLQVIALNPHWTYYHADDQPVDLRPIRDRFEVVYEYDEILRALQALAFTVTNRMTGYREGLNHDPIVVIIDEWPAIFQEHGDDAVKPLRRILMEGRKVNVYVVIATQTAVLKTLGLNSGDRSIFRTVLLSRVDNVTWRALMGDWAQPDLRWGEWASNQHPGKIFIFDRVQSYEVNAVEAQQAIRYVSILRKIPETDPDQISPRNVALQSSISQEPDVSPDVFALLAKLVIAGIAGETKILQVAFSVNPGSSARYKDLRAKLKAAIDQEQQHAVEA